MLTLLLVGFSSLVLYYAVVPRIVRWAFRAPRHTEQTTPARYGLTFQQVSISTENGKRLFAWYIPSSCKDPAPCIAILHGWGGNAEFMLPFAPVLHRAGYALLLLDSRNHGQSDQDDFSSMVKFGQDLDHGLDWLKSRPDIRSDRLAVLGHSVGAAAAILVASRRRDLSAVVSVASFAHPALFMRSYMAAHYVPYFPIGWWVLRYIERQIKARYDQIAPVHTIRKVACPVLLVHGELDAEVPVADARIIYNNRASNAVQLKVFTEVDHTSVEKIECYADELAAFFNENIA